MIIKPLITLMKRRLLLKTPVLVLSGSAVISACDVASPPDLNQVTRKITAILNHGDVAALLGQHYLDSLHESLSTIELLVNRLLKKINLNLEQTTNDQLNKLPELLSERVRNDFADESVVKIDGWMLAETEIEICALVYLTQ